MTVGDVRSSVVLDIEPGDLKPAGWLPDPLVLQLLDLWGRSLAAADSAAGGSPASGTPRGCPPNGGGAL